MCKYLNEENIMLYLICFNETKRSEQKCEEICKMWSTADSGWLCVADTMNDEDGNNIRLSQWAYVFIIMRYTLIRCLRRFFLRLWNSLFCLFIHFILCICFTCCSPRIFVTDNNHSNATTLAEFWFMHWKRLYAKCQECQECWILNEKSLVFNFMTPFTHSKHKSRVLRLLFFFAFFCFCCCMKER